MKDLMTVAIYSRLMCSGLCEMYNTTVEKLYGLCWKYCCTISYETYPHNQLDRFILYMYTTKENGLTISQLEDALDKSIIETDKFLKDIDYMKDTGTYDQYINNVNNTVNDTIEFIEMYRSQVPPVPAILFN